MEGPLSFPGEHRSLFDARLCLAGRATQKQVPQDRPMEDSFEPQERFYSPGLRGMSVTPSVTTLKSDSKLFHKQNSLSANYNRY